VEQRIYIPIGPIGSGKTTACKAWIAQHQPAVHIEGDALRTMLYGEYAYKPELEGALDNSIFVTSRDFWRNGVSVAIDDVAFVLRNYGLLTFSPSVVVDILPFVDEETAVARRMREPRGYTEGQWREVYRKHMQQLRALGLVRRE